MVRRARGSDTLILIPQYDSIVERKLVRHARQLNSSPVGHRVGKLMLTNVVKTSGTQYGVLPISPTTT